MKDNRLLPRGFDKATAEPDIAVRGQARPPTATSRATAIGCATRRCRRRAGAVHVDVELRYQPISFRWAENLRRYDAAEPRRFVSYYERTSASSSVEIARASARIP